MVVYLLRSVLHTDLFATTILYNSPFFEYKVSIGCPRPSSHLNKGSAVETPARSPMMHRLACHKNGFPKLIHMLITEVAYKTHHECPGAFMITNLTILEEAGTG